MFHWIFNRYSFLMVGWGKSSLKNKLIILNCRSSISKGMEWNERHQVVSQFIKWKRSKHTSTISEWKLKWFAFREERKKLRALWYNKSSFSISYSIEFSSISDAIQFFPYSCLDWITRYSITFNCTHPATC